MVFLQRPKSRRKQMCLDEEKGRRNIQLKETKQKLKYRSETIMSET